MSNYSYNGSLLKSKKKKKEPEKEAENTLLFHFDYMPPLLKPWQVADILGVTVRTVANYRLNGKLKGVYVSSKKHLYKSEDVEEFINTYYKPNIFE